MLEVNKATPVPAPAPIELPELSLAFMNEDHAHAAAQWAEMCAALDEYPERPGRLLQACAVFLEHSRAHFQREEEAMRASGFPPYAVHKLEHDRVLDWLAGLQAAVGAGEARATLRGVIERDVADWLLRHVQTMDAATARWIASQG